jgi:hypothetical protein
MGMHPKQERMAGELFATHKRNNAKINSVKRRLQEERLTATIKAYHKTVDTAKINNQLEGIVTDDALTPSHQL